MLFCGDTFLFSKNSENPFKHMLELFHEQIVCLNLETSLKSTAQIDKNVCLSVEKENFSYLSDQIHIVSLVNNHVRDSGDPYDLVQLLDQQKKIVIGPQNPAEAHTESQKLTVGFFSAYFNLPRLRMSYNGRRADQLEEMLLNSNAQKKIVNLHWGYEHINRPAPFQRKLAKRLIDAGADIIIGHHPHVPQGYECYKGKYIFYSLGNFNFWQFDAIPSEENQWGYMVDYNLLNGEARIIPYRINQEYQPYPLSPDDTEILNKQLLRLNQKVSTSNSRQWFYTAYAKWYIHELSVWSTLCQERKSLRLWAKWAVWLCIPLQLKYYFLVALSKISPIKRK